MRVVDALPAIRSSRFDLPLTYDAGSLELRIGEIVRVPLGNSEALAFVVSLPREVEEPAQALKPILERLDVPRAFGETGLHLARFVADHYVCTLGEALSGVVLANAIPRMRASFVRAAQPEPAPPPLSAAAPHSLDLGGARRRVHARAAFTPP